MIRKKFIALILALIMALPTFGLAAAQGEIAACEGDEIVGSIISVDEETGQFVVQTETGQCYLSMDQLFDHPIVALFDDYFGADNATGFEEALAGLQGWALDDEETDTWLWVDEGTEGALPATISAFYVNEDGTTYTVEFTLEGMEDPALLTLTDEEEIAHFMALYEATHVELSLVQDEEGNSFISSVGDDVTAYHEDGMGFGVLVKFYSLASEYDVSMAEMVYLFKEEKTGLGLLFSEYGSPDMMGVGHIKQTMKNDAESLEQTEEHGKKNKPEKQNNGGNKGNNENKGNKGKNND